MEELTVAVMGCEEAKELLVKQFVDVSWPQEHCHVSKQILIGDKPVLLTIMADTRGDEEYSVLRDRFIRNTEGFILVYSVNEMFDQLRYLKQRIWRCKDTDAFPLVVVGSQCQKESERLSKGKELAKEFGCPFFETSAKECHNVDAIFFDIAHQILEKRSKLSALPTSIQHVAIGLKPGLYNMHIIVQIPLLIKAAWV